MAFQSPGLTPEQAEEAVAAQLGWATTNATELSRIDQAITYAGQAACAWRGRDWWFLKAASSFDTVAGTESYALRTYLSDESLHGVERMYYSTQWPLSPMTWQEYQERDLLDAESSTPLSYVIVGNPPTAYLYPEPNAADTIYVNYVKRHGKITNSGSTTSDLVIPPEFQYDIYVNTASWILRNDITNPLSLEQCPSFADAMRRMGEADPAGYDVDQSHAGWPNNRRVFEDGGVTWYEGTVSV